VLRLPAPAAVALCLALAGCAQLPHADGIASSGLAAPSAWSTTDTAIKTLPAQDLGAWWRRFDDATLDQLIDDALRGSLDLRTAQARLRQARASRDLAVANLYPSLGVSASANRSSSGTGAGGDGTTHTFYAAGFDASWEPPVFNGLRDAASAAEADAAASAASLAATRVSLVAEVALDYVTLRAYQQRLAIARDNVASQAETLQITEWRQQAGLATMLDVEQARANLEQTRASIPSLETGRAEAEHGLAVLTGQPPGALQSRLAAARPLPEAPDEVAVGIPADAIRQRPDVHAAELTLQAEIARSAQQEAARYPSLNMSGSFGWQAFSAAALGGGDTLVRSLAASLGLNLFDGGRIGARIAIQDAVQEQALIAYQSSVLTALEDVENALAGYAAGRERVASSRRAAEAARNAADLARNLYQAGAVDFQKVLDTDRTRLSAEDSLASAESDLLATVIKLYKALGGGWRSAAAADADAAKERS
jgi:outer membrane protein, multidrug efflux system